MAEPQVIEGTWEEIARHAGELAASGKRLRLIVPPDEVSDKTEETRPAGRAYFGIFKGITQATEEDFREVEFHGDPDDGLDRSE